MTYSDKVEIRTNGLESNPSLRKKIINSTERLFRHESRIERIYIWVSKYPIGNNHHIHTIVGRIAVPGPDLVLEVQGKNLDKLITSASHKMDRLIRRRSRKISIKKKSTRLKDFELSQSTL